MRPIESFDTRSERATRKRRAAGSTDSLLAALKAENWAAVYALGCRLEAAGKTIKRLVPADTAHRLKRRGD